MSATQLADIIEPATFLQYMAEERPQRNQLVQAGIYAAAPPEVQSQMNAGGSTIDMPFWKDLDRTEPNIMSDDPAEKAVPDKMTSNGDAAVKQFLHKSWSYMQLAAMISGGDPARHLAQFVTGYWQFDEQQRLIKSLLGIQAANIAGAADMTFGSPYADVASPTSANKVSHAAITRARLTMGDALDELVAICMHSKVYGDLLEQEQIEFRTPSEAPGKIPYYGDLQVLFDDDMPVTNGVNSPKYTSFLIGRGAFAYAEADPSAKAVEVEGVPDAGNGGGQEVLHNRKVCLIHPRGVKFTKSSMAKKSPSYAEMADAANWQRVMDRKHVRFAYLETN